MIKKILLPMLLSIIIYANSSQLMFNDYESYSKSGFITTEIKSASINNSALGYTDAERINIYYYGTTAAMLFDNNFYGGGAIYIPGADFLANGAIKESKVGMTYFGGVFGVAPDSSDQIHVGYRALLGFGSAYDSRFNEIDWVLVFEPEVSLEINMTNFTKFKIGLSWLITQGVDENHASNGWFGSTFMSGYESFPNITMALIFGEY